MDLNKPTKSKPPLLRPIDLLAVPPAIVYCASRAKRRRFFTRAKFDARGKINARAKRRRYFARDKIAFRPGVTQFCQQKFY